MTAFFGERGYQVLACSYSARPLAEEAEALEHRIRGVPVMRSG